MGHLVGTNGFNTAFWGSVGVDWGRWGSYGAMVGAMVGPMLGQTGARTRPRWAADGLYLASLGRFQGYVGASLGHVVGTNGFNTAFWGCVGVALGPMGTNRGHVMAILGPCWAAHGLCWAHLGPFWAILPVIAGCSHSAGKTHGFVLLLSPNTSPMQDSCSQCNAFCSITW